ncbi:PUA domain-containing protein, partial [Nocardia wallacei]|uniref:PUA domain-containing protein n=1 Tax=Nocardia wallacei TaxID=480035 RepID=UPI00313B1534
PPGPPPPPGGGGRRGGGGGRAARGPGRAGAGPPPPPPNAGVPVLLAAATDAAAALTGASVGTAFAARPVRLSARKFWVRHAADSRGAVLLDEGAVQAVAQCRRSLLAAGITGVRGRFHGGDVIDLVAPDGHVVARGVAEYDSTELQTMVGRSTSELPEGMQRPVIHADDLVKV